MIMGDIETLRMFVNQRLTAAAEDILAVFGRAIVQYQQEIDLQRKQMGMLNVNPDMRCHCQVPDFLHLPVCEEEPPPEQQNRSPGLSLDVPEPPQMKQEQRLEETQVSTLTLLRVKSENDEDTLQSSQLHQGQYLENREEEPLASTSSDQIKNEAGVEFCRDSTFHLNPASDLVQTGETQLLSSVCSEIEDSDGDCRMTREPQAGLYNSKTSKSSIELCQELKSTEVLSSPCCKVCKQSFPSKHSLMMHVKVHSSDCALCGKHLEPTETLELHLEVHRTCKVCGKTFPRIWALETHMRSHTGERPFMCTICGQSFGQKGTLKIHIRTHTGHKPYSCFVCGKTFYQTGDLNRHMRTHSGERPYSCTVCSKSFGQKEHLKTHMISHTKDKPFSCSVCDKSFGLKENLKVHMRTHMKVVPYRCAVCGQSFRWQFSMQKHMKTHANYSLEVSS